MRISTLQRQDDVYIFSHHAFTPAPFVFPVRRSTFAVHQSSLFVARATPPGPNGSTQPTILEIRLVECPSIFELSLGGGRQRVEEIRPPRRLSCRPDTASGSARRRPPESLARRPCWSGPPPGTAPPSSDAVSVSSPRGAAAFQLAWRSSDLHPATGPGVLHGDGARGSGPGASATWRTSTTPSVAITPTPGGGRRAPACAMPKAGKLRSFSCKLEKREFSWLSSVISVYDTVIKPSLPERGKHRAESSKGISFYGTRRARHPTPLARALQPPERLRGGDELLSVPHFFVRVPPQRRLLVCARERVRAHAFRPRTEPKRGEVPGAGPRRRVLATRRPRRAARSSLAACAAACARACALEPARRAPGRSASPTLGAHRVARRRAPQSGAEQHALGVGGVELGEGAPEPRQRGRIARTRRARRRKPRPRAFRGSYHRARAPRERATRTPRRVGAARSPPPPRASRAAAERRSMRAVSWRGVRLRRAAFRTARTARRRARAASTREGGGGAREGVCGDGDAAERQRARGGVLGDARARGAAPPRRATANPTCWRTQEHPRGGVRARHARTARRARSVFVVFVAYPRSGKTRRGVRRDQKRPRARPWRSKKRASRSVFPKKRVFVTRLGAARRRRADARRAVPTVPAPISPPTPPAQPPRPSRPRARGCRHRRRPRRRTRAGTTRRSEGSHRLVLDGEWTRARRRMRGEHPRRCSLLLRLRLRLRLRLLLRLRLRLRLRLLLLHRLLLLLLRASPRALHLSQGRRAGCSFTVSATTTASSGDVLAGLRLAVRTRRGPARRRRRRVGAARVHLESARGDRLRGARLPGFQLADLARQRVAAPPRTGISAASSAARALARAAAATDDASALARDARRVGGVARGTRPPADSEDATEDALVRIIGTGGVCVVFFFDAVAVWWNLPFVRSARAALTPPAAAARYAGSSFAATPYARAASSCLPSAVSASPTRTLALAHARLDARSAARVLQRAARIPAERENGGEQAVGVGFGVRLREAVSAWLYAVIAARKSPVANASFPRARASSACAISWSMDEHPHPSTA